MFAYGQDGLSSQPRPLDGGTRATAQGYSVCAHVPEELFTPNFHPARGRRPVPFLRQSTRESSDSLPVSDWLVAERISTGTISPGLARPSKFTTLLCVVRPRS